VTVHGRAVADLVPHQRCWPRRSLVPAAGFDELIAAAGPAPTWRSGLATWPAPTSVIPFDIAAVQSYGLLANLARAAGRGPRPWRLDLLVAATAERRGLSLATRNAADFRYLERVLDVVEVP